jgi:DNA polymerase III subunit delta
MEYKEILEQIRKKIYHPVYFLSGEEPYYIDIISDYIEENVLTQAEKGFNQTVFYGKDTDLMTVLEAARRYPMMANQQVIIVKEAQSWKKFEPLVKYLTTPSKTTILVINYKYTKLDKRTDEAKIIKEKTIFLETSRLRDYEVPKWIESHIISQGHLITPQATQMLADFLGSDLSKIANEVNKLSLVVAPGKKITPEDIEKNIGISKEYNTFELTDALAEKNVLKANRIVNYFATDPNTKISQILSGALFNYFSKLFKYHFLPDKSENSVSKALEIHRFFVRNYAEAAKRYNKTKIFEIIGFIREYDMKNKGLESSGVAHGDLLKEMVYKILH